MFATSFFLGIIFQYFIINHEQALLESLHSVIHFPQFYMVLIPYMNKKLELERKSLAMALNGKLLLFVDYLGLSNIYLTLYLLDPFCHRIFIFNPVEI